MVSNHCSGKRALHLVLVFNRSKVVVVLLNAKVNNANYSPPCPATAGSEGSLRHFHRHFFQFFEQVTYTNRDILRVRGLIPSYERNWCGLTGKSAWMRNQISARNKVKRIQKLWFVCVLHPLQILGCNG